MKRQVKRIRGFFADNWAVIVAVTAGIGAILTILLIKLGSLVGGLSDGEYLVQQQLANNEVTLESLLRHPLYLPYYFGVFLAQFLPWHGPTVVRGISVVFGLAALGSFFYILRRWYSVRIATFGLGLLASTSWFLHTARFAAPEVSYLLLPVIIALAVFVQNKPQSRVGILTLVATAVLGIYVPGLVWIIVPGLILWRKQIIATFKTQPLWFNALSSSVAIIFLIPLITMIAWPYVKSEVGSTLLTLAGLPTQFPPLYEFVRNLTNALGQVFTYSFAGPLTTVGHLPLLDAATTGLVLLGFYHFVLNYKLHRTQLLGIVILVSLILIATGGPVTIAILLPIVYLLAVEGLRWLLDAWLKVFPRNPVARGFGVSVIALLVVSTAYYHNVRYFQAWANSPETRAVFHKLP